MFTIYSTVTIFSVLRVANEVYYKIVQKATIMSCNVISLSLVLDYYFSWQNLTSKGNTEF